MQFMGIDVLLSAKFPEVDWYVEGLIPAQAITIISAMPGSYKTWFLVNMAIAIASGKPLFDHFPVNQAGVLLIDEENGDRLLQRIFKALGSEADLPIYSASYQDFDTSDDSIDKVIDFCKEKNLSVVMIDTLVRIHSGNENEAGDMAKVFKGLRKLTQAGLTLVITHHNRKPNQNSTGTGHELRGSSDILAAIDCHISLARKKQLVEVSQTKLRYDIELPKFVIEVEQYGDSTRFNYIGEAELKRSKRERISEEILNLLSVFDKLSASEVRHKLSETGLSAGEKMVSEELQSLVLVGQVKEEKGAKNAKYYSLLPIKEES